MSNLLDKASILLTPTAYNNGSMLSIKPENGNGDFDFSRSSSATRVNSNGNIVTESANTPRIDYTDGCGSWFIEPQSTNVIVQSESLDIASVNRVNATITDNYGTSPSGEIKSSRIQFGDHESFCNSVINISINYTSSVFVKGVSGETIRFGIGLSVESGGLFTFNGLWQRISFTASSASQIFFSTYGATARDFEAFGLQLENQSYATSYIPTNGATKTRLQDIVNNSGNATLINSTEGVLYAEIEVTPFDSGIKGLEISDGSTSNIISLHFVGGASSTSLNARFRVGGTNVFQQQIKSNINYNQNYKIAFKWKQDSFKIYVDGVLEYSLLSGNTFTADTLNNIDFNYVGNSNFNFYGKVKALAVYKEALTDAELQSLTTI